MELLNQAFAHSLVLSGIPNVQSSLNLLEFISLEMLRPPVSAIVSFFDILPKP